jgi:divalent metal cation (Fe/Co/Zn/Cd) transporter
MTKDDGWDGPFYGSQDRSAQIWDRPSGDNLWDSQVRDGQTRDSQRVLWVWLWLILLGLAVEWGMGWATHGLSLMVQSLHTGMDSLSLLFSILATAEPGLAPSGQSGGRSRQQQALGAIFLLGFMGCVACGVLVLAGQRLLWQSVAGQMLPLPFTAIQLLLVVIALYLGLAGLGHTLGWDPARRMGKGLLFGAAQRTLRGAARLGLVVLVGIAVPGGQAGVDLLLAMGLLGCLGYRGWRLLAQQWMVLQAQPAIAPEALTQMIHQVEGITQCDQVRSQGLVGRHLFVEMHLVLHPECQDMAQTIAERVKAVIQRRFGPTQVVIHIAGDGVYADESGSVES